MKHLALAFAILFCSLPACADPVYFLGLDRGVYVDSGSGIKRVGLGTGVSLAVHGATLYLVGGDGQLWSADSKGRWLPRPGASQLRKVLVDSSGTVFVLGGDGGVYRFDGRLTRRGLAVVSDFAISGNGDLYGIGTDRKVWVSRSMPGGQDSWVPYNALAQGKQVAVAPDGTVYVIGTDDGIYQVGPRAVTRLGLASGQEIAVSSGGQVGIVGVDGGVYLLEGRSSTWRRLGSGTARSVVWSR